MTETTSPAPDQDLTGLVGHHFIYTYANGWQYEMYVKNDATIDYRIHSGMVGGRWVKDQQVDVVRLTDDVYKISWVEPTGTCVVVDVMPGLRRVHGTIFFPAWVEEDGSKTVLFQNDHLPLMTTYRDEGPTYPIHVVPEFAQITFLENVGVDDDTVVAVAPGDLPDGYATRRN